MSLVRTPGGAHALQAGSSSAGAMLPWWAERVGAPVGVLLAEAADALRSGVVTLPTRVLVLPHLDGRQCPSPDAAARPRVVADGGRAAMTVAVVEGVCLQARWMLEEQARLAGTGALTAPVVLGGRLGADPVWGQVKPSVHPVRAWTVAGEPVATGAALLAAARAGLLGEPRAALLHAPVLASAPPRAATSAAYDQVLTRFCDAARGATP